MQGFNSQFLCRNLGANAVRADLVDYARRGGPEDRERRSL